MERIPSREEILESTRERANSRSSHKSFESESEEEAHYMQMFVIYLKSAIQFIEILPQIQNVILKEDLENLPMSTRMDMLESLVDSCGSSFNINTIVEGLSNRLPMPFREQPIKSKATDIEMLEKDIFEQAIISSWYIYPGYSLGLHSVLEYLAERMEAEYLQEFSPACIQVLEEVGSRRDSTAKAARTVLHKLHFGDEDSVVETAEIVSELHEEDDGSSCCFSHECSEFFRLFDDFFRGFVKIEYSEEKNDKLTLVQVQVEPEIL